MSLILIVDDDAHTRHLFVSMLTPFGHEVIEAGDGKEGLAMAGARKPDLIISDVLMPSMNGYEFVTSLRKTPGLESIPVIFHSASFLDHQTRTLGDSCGVSHFIPKPCDPETSIEIIHKALGIKVGTPAPPSETSVKQEAIPFLIDAFFEKGKELDAASLRLASLLDLGVQLAHAGDVPTLLRTGATAARDVVGANYAVAAIWKEGAERPEFLSIVGMDSETVQKIGLPAFDANIFRTIVSDSAPKRIFNREFDPSTLGLPKFHPPVNSFLGVPLRAGDHVFGWIYVAEKLSGLEFDREDERMMTALAAQLALAYENSLNLLSARRHAVELEAEVEQRKSAENKFRMLIETSPMGIVITDASGVIVEVNAQSLKMFGYEAAELRGKSVEILLPRHLKAVHENHRAGYIGDPHARQMGVGKELSGRRKDGTEFPLEISLGPLKTAEGIFISSVIVDITARKKLERQLRLSQRMEAIGALAGGVAHDFNNLLAVIIGGAEITLDTLPAEHPAIRKIHMIKQAGESAAELTRQLLAFGRQQMLQPRVLDIRGVVDKAKILLSRLIGENIEVKTTFDPSLGNVMADPSQIEQVVLNLAVNARDAMPRGGRLTIEARNVELDETYVEEHQQAIPGRYVMLSVEDTGCGMDRETQARIFDPFFTTKELGKGTGLGLATVYGVVKQSGGYIWVYSELRKGTIFRIYLPLVEQSSASPKQNEPELLNVGGSETILLAEDSDALRKMAKEYLESLGYTVLEAASGYDALQLAREFDGTIHVLLSDVVMPEMSGPDLARELVGLRPGIKIILMSGYTDDTITREGVLDSSVTFLQKPYRPRVLAGTIRAVLNDGRAASAKGTQSKRPFPINA